MVWIAIPFLVGVFLAHEGAAFPTVAIVSSLLGIAPLSAAKRIAIIAALICGVLDVLCRAHGADPADTHMRTLHATILEDRALDDDAQSIVARIDDGERRRRHESTNSFAKRSI